MQVIREVSDLSGLLSVAGHAMTNRVAVALAEVELTPRAQCVLIHALEEDRTQAQLAAIAGMDKTTMVNTMDDLERRGLAERRPAPTDRRARIIAVTEAGRQAAEEGQRIVDRVHAESLASLPDQVREAFLQGLMMINGEISGQAANPIRRARQAR